MSWTDRNWGLLTAVDLYGCRPDTIRSKSRIENFAHTLCDLIEVKRYGETLVVHFGADPRVCGYSLVQLIETSLISGHFREADNACHIDIFSCKEYDPDKAAGYCKYWFEAAAAQHNVVWRPACLTPPPPQPTGNAASPSTI